MEEQNLTPETTQENKTNVLRQVTPFSKYLALALFIILPFVGGWIGYAYAPEKVVVQEVLVQVSEDAEEVINTPYRNVESFFFTSDVFCVDEAVLEGDVLYWQDTCNQSSYNNYGWSSTTVSESASLSYLGRGLFFDDVEIYSLYRVIGEGLSQFDVSKDLSLFATSNHTFIANGDNLFLFDPFSPLVGIIDVGVNTGQQISSIDDNYFTVGSKVYYIPAINSIGGQPVVYEQKGALPKSLTYIDKEDVDAEFDIVTSEGNVYALGQLLEGVDAASVQFTVGGEVVYDEDTVWVFSGGCHLSGYERGSRQDIDTHKASC